MIRSNIGIIMTIKTVKFDTTEELIINKSTTKEQKIVPKKFHWGEKNKKQIFT